MYYTLLILMQLTSVVMKEVKSLDRYGPRHYRVSAHNAKLHKYPDEQGTDTLEQLSLLLLMGISLKAKNEDRKR